MKVILKLLESLLVFVLVTWIVLGCRKGDDDPVPESSQNCNLLEATRDGNLDWVLEYDQNGRLKKDVGAKTYHKYIYTYNEDGFLTKATSLFEGMTIKLYKYQRNQLTEIAISDTFSTAITTHSFEYDSQNNLVKLLTTFSNQSPNTDKTYTTIFKNDKIISHTIKGISGERQPYVFQNGNAIKYSSEYGSSKMIEYDNKNRISKISTFYHDGQLDYYQTATYQEGKTEWYAFPGFKGFPKIINNRVQGHGLTIGIPSLDGIYDIQNLLKTDIYYQIIDGKEVKTLERQFTYVMNSKGFPLKTTINTRQFHNNEWIVNPPYITNFTYQDCK